MSRVTLLYLLVARASALAVPENFTRCEEGPVGFLSSDRLRSQAPRIIGGTEAPPNAYPHQVSLQVFYEGKWLHFCGGSITGSDKVITAAHCIYYTTDYTIRVVAGEHDFRYCNGTEQYREVKSARIHPNYKAESPDYDYGVIRVTEPFILNSVVNVIQLASQEPVAGNCINTGWGNIRMDDFVLPPTLQHVTIPIVPRDDCLKSYPGAITGHMICAGASGRGPCFGDSGGPLMCNGVLAGIVSWGRSPCAQDGSPGVFANVAAALEWLSS